MMDFPASPYVGQTYQASTAAPTYKYDGIKWKISSGPVAALPATTLPLMDDISSPGITTNWSRADHRHPTDTKLVPVDNPTFNGTLTAQTFNVSGNFNGGLFATTADGNQLGNHIRVDGTAANWNGVTTLDANIIFYDYGGGNWAGIGSDQSGFIWVRTGGGGSDNVSAMVATVSGGVQFNGAVYAPSPGNGDNSTRAATTAYVIANQPVGGPYLPITGGTLTGTLTVSGAHIMPYRGGATGVCYFGTGATDRYLYYDGGNYILSAGILNTAAGRIWGTGDWTRPVTGAHLGGHAGDYMHLYTEGLVEPYGGAPATGGSGAMLSGYYTSQVRHRYNQIYVEGTWYTSGFV